MKLMAGKLPPVSGRITPGHHAVIGYQAQEFSELLPDEMSVYDAVRAALPAGASTANLMNILGSFGFSGDDVEKRCGVLSGGERIRVQFARIFVNPPNFLLLDEPTTHLDLSARELLQQALCDFPGTVCIVSHDIEFVRNVAGTILALEPGGVKKYYGNYDYYLEKSGALLPDPAQKSNASGTQVQESAKARRQERARARQAIQGDLKKAREKVAQLEKEYESFNSRKELLVSLLSNGGKMDFAALKKELSEVEDALKQCEKDWEKAAETLEELQYKNDLIDAN
jgi:ATP-binding cassette subfamily F protein 3